MKPALVLAACLAALSGCAPVGRVAAPKAVLDFGPPVAALPAAARPGVGIEVRAAPWFDSLGIEYRLAYADSHRLHDYAESRWAGPPAQLVAQRLRQRLQPAAAAAGHCSLLLSLDELSQIFDTPETSRGVLRGTATLNDRRGLVLARQAVAADAAAPTADARGGVVALAAAVDRSAEAIAGWLDDMARRGQLGGCSG